MAKKVNLDIAQDLNITCRRGDTFNLTVTLKDSAGTGLQLKTGKYKFIMQVRDNAFQDGSEGLLLCTVAGQPTGSSPVGNIEAMESDGTSGGTTNVNDSGQVTIFISDSVMREVPSGRYVYDLQYVIPAAVAEGADTHTTILKGAFVVNEDVSEFAEAVQERRRKQ